MDAYAVVETGGKQYRVKTGDSLAVERLDSEVGKKVVLSAVLAVSDGKKLSVGTPEVSGKKVSAEVVSHIRGPKLVSYKQKRRKGSSRKKGHRQELTVLKINKIT